MTIANKYIQQCKSLFPVYGKLERTFLNRLKVQVNEHLDLFPDIRRLFQVLCKHKKLI